MVTVRKSYNSKFIIETVKLITSGGASADHVARDFGIHIKTLFRWIGQHTAKQEEIFPGKATLTTDAEIIRKLKRENAELRKKLAE